MTMRVVYHDNTHDMISAYTLDPLIESKKIKMFYRPSEDRWITVGVDSVRKNTQELGHYDGSERRLANLIAAQLV
jgi:hypothetical protein